ncbi:hypothetical protein PLCT2_03062 [Planctomycetaceae bacterium]|nr:hypothetical protein PLCT2_03062 [Planctomycetaceae bacterium]
MGLFDWLFGRKKKDPPTYRNPYPPKVHSFSEFSADSTLPAPRQQARRNKPTRRKLQPFAPQSYKGHRTLGLSWRRERSKEPVDRVPNSYLSVAHFQHFGGTPSSIPEGGDAAKLLNVGLPVLRHFNELAALLEIDSTSLYKLVVRTSAQHYLFHEIAKKSGGIRLLMAPLPRMKAAQRRLLQALVSKVPLHLAAHGFREGQDVLTNAGPHVGKPIVICMDISDFFPSFTFRRVSGFFRHLGYPRGIAVALANLTTWSPRGQFQLPQTTGRNLRSVDYKERKVQLARAEWLDSGGNEIPSRMWPQLPQGAPTSPGLANAIVWRMDKRLSALARKFGGDYTRYADDLTFSGFEKMAEHSRTLISLVEKIVKTEGLTINVNKTRVMRKGRRQKVTGVVVNKQTNASREQFDLLKAILHNCAKKGPSTQNRSNHPNFKEHLRGRVAHIAHIGPERGAKLKKLFDQIDWSR